MRTILIQPHPDDIAFSLGGLVLTKFFESMEPPLVITVFSKSNFFNKHIERNITMLRKEEDQKFMKKINMPYISLDFGDSSTRGYKGLAECTKPTDPNQDPLYEDVKRMLLRLVPKNATLVVPMAIGNHIDHLMCREIFKDFPFLMVYEDVPYVLDCPVKQYKDFEKIQIDITEVMKLKMENLNIYESQYDEKTFNRVSQHMVESIWVRKKE